MTQMTFPLVFPATRRTATAAPMRPAGPPMRGVTFVTALAISLGPVPATVPDRADRGVIVAGPRVPVAAPRSWITSW